MMAYLKDMLLVLRAKLAKAHKSFTIWFNGIVGSLLVVLPYALDQWQGLHGMINESFYHNITVLLVVGNILARFKTSGGLETK